MADATTRHHLMVRLTEVLAEIEDVRQRRTEVDPGDFGLRLELKERDRELHAEMARLREQMPPDDPAEVRRQLGAVEQRLAELASSRIDVVGQAGGGGQGGDFGLATDALKLNWQIDAAADRPALEKRAKELRDLLGELEGS